MRSKVECVYFRDCRFCGERFVSNRSNKVSKKLFRLNCQSARPDSVCCNVVCGARMRAHGSYERWVLSEQQEDAKDMLSEQSSNQWRRMISLACVARVRQQVSEMQKRLHKKCKTCDQSAVFQKWYCGECKKKRDRDTCTKGNHRKRCKKHGTVYHHGVTIRAVAHRDGMRCHYCGKLTERWAGHWFPEIATLDHVIPISKGGDHSMENVVIACGECNSKKGSSAETLFWFP